MFAMITLDFSMLPIAMMFAAPLAMIGCFIRASQRGQI